MADQAGSGSLPAVAELLGYLWGMLPWWQWQTGTEKFTRCMWVKGLNFLIEEKGGEEGGWWCIHEGQYPSEKYQAHSPIATGMAGGNADWHSSSSLNSEQPCSDRFPLWREGECTLLSLHKSLGFALLWQVESKKWEKIVSFFQSFFFPYSLYLQATLVLYFVLRDFLH